MSEDPAETIELLTRWHQGDRGALDSLLTRDLDWLTQEVSRRLGRFLRGKSETVDFVQDALIEVLEYGPKFTIADKQRFRALLVRIVENNLRDQNDWFRARRRDAAREHRDGSILDLDRVIDSDEPTPSKDASDREDENWVRLALELLDPDDRRVIVLREWEKLSFEDAGQQLGITAEAARKRFTRALPKLVDKVSQLQQGRLRL